MFGVELKTYNGYMILWLRDYYGDKNFQEKVFVSHGYVDANTSKWKIFFENEYDACLFKITFCEETFR